MSVMLLTSVPSASYLEDQETRPAPGSTPRATQNDTHFPNVVLFGETGVGKSSLINLIAGRYLAPSSNDAVGCTTEARSYNVHFPSDDVDTSRYITLWDTAGLDEGTRGTVPATTAATYLKTLLHTLARSPSGVHLLLFCIRGTARLTRAVAHRYNLVHAGICRKKVPIVLVVTGLEHLDAHGQVGAGMERWWTEHADEVARLGMVFDAHACVTTMELAVEGFERDRRMASQRLLWGLVMARTRPGMVPWRIGPPWQSVVVLCLVRIRRTLDSNEESKVDTSAGVRRHYTALRQWLTRMIRFITDRILHW